MLDRCRWFGGLLLLTSVPLAAQSVWVVDAAGGAGSAFTSIASAIASTSVADGDTLLVRPGTYLPFVLSRPLSITCPGVATVNVPTGAPQGTFAVAVSVVAAGRQARIEGFQVVLPSATSVGAFKIDQCAGDVLLSRLGPINTFANGVGLPSLNITNSASVVCSRFDFSNACGVWVRASSVCFVNGVIDGRKGGTAPGLAATPALDIADSFSELCDCNLRGGALTVGNPAAPAVLMRSQQGPCTILFRRMGDARLESGSVLGIPSAPALETVGTGCMFVFDPAITIACGLPIVTGPVRLIPLPMAGLVADDSGLGSVLYRLRGEANQAGIVLFSLAEPTLVFGMPGWANPLTGIGVPVTISSTGRLDLGYTLPARDYRTTIAAQFFPIGFPFRIASNSAFVML